MLMGLDTAQARIFGIRGPAEAFAPQIALQIYVCAGDLFVSSRSAVRVKVVKLAP